MCNARLDDYYMKWNFCLSMLLWNNFEKSVYQVSSSRWDSSSLSRTHFVAHHRICFCGTKLSLRLTKYVEAYRSCVVLCCIILIIFDLWICLLKPSHQDPRAQASWVWWTTARWVSCASCRLHQDSDYSSWVIKLSLKLCITAPVLSPPKNAGTLHQKMLIVLDQRKGKSL